MNKCRYNLQLTTTLAYNETNSNIPNTKLFFIFIGEICGLKVFVILALRTITIKNGLRLYKTFL